MPHTQIVFVKVKMELLEDDRFLFDLNDTQKGLYLLLLALAGKTSNKIRNEENFIRTRLALSTNTLMEDIKHISAVYPKFKLVNDYWVFEDFDEHHNYYYPTKGNTEVLPKVYQNKNKKENKSNIASTNIPTKDQVLLFFKNSASENEGLKFWEYYEMVGWVVGKARKPIKNWEMAAHRWIKNNSNGNQPRKQVIG